ncbi:antitoxin VbhA family protein [Bartonella gliris]|uniref:antitoxin VbhA family protein n=1 Tax=Bartonella gliris TaxID=3004109 RepID=UPI003872FF62
MESKALENTQNTVIYENGKQRDFPKIHLKRTQRTFKKETCIKTTPTDHFTSFTSKGLQKHCERVDTAISTYALEGVTLPQKMLEISKEYAKGNYLRKEFNTLMNHPIF